MSLNLQHIATTKIRLHSPHPLASVLVTCAKKAGKLKVEPCWLCGNPKSEAHHPNYERYDEIQWLCRKCHRGVHRKERKLQCDRLPIKITFRPKIWPPKTGGSYYVRIPLYLQTRTEMKWSIENIADCEVTFSEDVKTRETLIHIAPKKEVEHGV